MPDYTIPVLHPILVHFPIALLIVAAPISIAWAIRRTGFWRGATLLTTLLGALGALAAYLTGEAVEEQSEGVPIVDLFVEQHETLGLWTVIVAGVAALAVMAMAGLERRGKALPAGWRWLVAALTVAAAVLVARTAHLGGLMVWGVPN